MFDFFIIGGGRGGTSLLAGLLDAHEQLTVAFEKYAIELLVCATPGGPRIPARSIAEACTRIAAFRDACLYDPLGAGDLIRGNKITTEQITGVRVPGLDSDKQAIDRFLGLMGNIRYVFILRDGRTCVRSKVRRTAQSVETACRNWQFSVRVYEAMCSDSVNAVTIRFEDLLTRPEQTLNKVCSFLGVPFDQRMFEGTNSDKMLSEYRQQSIDPSKIALDDIPEGTLDRIEGDLRACGYIS